MRRRLLGLCWILVLAVLVGGCMQASTSMPSPSPARTVDYAATEAAIENKIRSGSLNLSTIDAVLLSVGGETKIAHYRNGSKPEDALHVWSVTKSVVSALIGIAIDEKIISGLDANLSELLRRYRKYLTAEEKSITLRQLISMTAGFPPDDPDENIYRVFEQRTDPIPMILSEGLDQPPGHAFSYSSRGAHLVSAVLREGLARAHPDHPRTAS
jgi:CubicO group peptidase (beta-lactamase class C family)